MIEAIDICKQYEDKEVLKGVTATFSPGECSMIIGKSGAGKTVLMKCLVGLEHADSGQILYDGTDLYSMDDKRIDKMRQEMGMLFQSSALFDSMNIYENVLFPLEMFSRESARSRRNRVKECLTRVQLYDAKDKYPGEISGGMKKRAAIARAIALRPKYLFCDEPNSGLDPETSRVIDTLLREITIEGNITTIINTHDMSSVSGIGDHVIFISNGMKRWEGPGSEIEASGDELLKNFVYLSQQL